MYMKYLVYRCTWVPGEITVWIKQFTNIFGIRCSWISDFKFVCQYCSERSVPRNV